MISAMGMAMTLGHGDQPDSGLRDVVIERNRFFGCGGGGQAVIAAVYPQSGLKVERVLIRDNQTTATSEGSPELDSALVSAMAPL